MRNNLVYASDLYAREFHGTFGENNRQVIARDPTLTHSTLPLSFHLLPILMSSFTRFNPSSDTRPEHHETPHLVFSPQFFRHICFCLATTMHRLYRYDIKICAAMYLLLSFFLRLPSLLLRRFLPSYCSSPYFPFADTSPRRLRFSYEMQKIQSKITLSFCVRKKIWDFGISVLKLINKKTQFSNQL